MDASAFTELTPAPCVLAEVAEAYPTHVRYRWGPADAMRSVTLAEHARGMANLSGFVRKVGVSPGEVGAIFAPNHVRWMEAALGLQAVGAVMVPVYGSSTPAQLGYILRHSAARLLFVDSTALLARTLDAWADLAPGAHVVYLGDDLDLDAARAAASSPPPTSDVEGRVVPWAEVQAKGEAYWASQPETLAGRLATIALEDRAIMLYTSGTTGDPKGVPLTHRNLLTNQNDWFHVLAPLLELEDEDLLWLPMSHIFGYGEAGAGNQLGWVSYLSDPKSVVTDLPRARPDVFMSVPSVWEKLASTARGASENKTEQLAKLDAITGGKLRFCLSGGAGLKREVKQLFHDKGVLIIEGYGLTECAPTLTLNRPDAFRFDAVGKPLPSVELKLAEDGEILARGPNVFRGYHKNPQATKDAFTEDGWFKTGDVGRWTDDGFLQIVDRKKDILVTAGGKNIAPANIEVRFNDDPFIAHVVVYGDGQKYLVAGVWLNGEVVKQHLLEQDAMSDAAVTPLVQKRIDRVNAQLARYETIKKFQVFADPLTVEGGLLTPTFKIRRKKIYEAYGEQLAALY